MSLFRAALDGLVPYEPGKPEEEVQRELGLARVVKLASNEGPWGPFPAALEALDRSAGSLNRYPDGGAFHLRNAIAERHGVDAANVITGAGADAIIGHLSVAALDPGDEVVTAWPSFISYVLDALKVGAVPRKVPLVDDHYDLDALLAAIGPKTKLVYIATPNNPTGHDDDARAARLLLRPRPRARAHRARPGLLRVHRPARLSRRRRGVPREGQPRARAADVLEDLRAGRPAGRLRRRPAGRDPGDRQDAAGVRRRHAGPGRRARQHRRRRRSSPSAAGSPPKDAPTLERTLREHGLEPAGPAVANFLFVEVGDDAPALFDALLRQGAIVRPMGAFGAPGALRITVGTPEENAFFADALASVRAATT